LIPKDYSGFQDQEIDPPN